MPTITVSDRLPPLTNAMGRQPCSDPVLLDLTDIEQIDREEIRITWLSERERQQLMRYSLPKRRKEWIAGRICAKIALQDYLNAHGFWEKITGYSDLSIINSDSGRPYIILEGNRKVFKLPDISISHSHGLALALAAESSCGVDIQQTNQTMVRVKERYCTAREEELLLSTVENDYPLMHLSMIWAAKEAAQKALSIVDMPGLLDLVLICIEKTGFEGLLFIFHRYHRHARLASEIRVLATGFKEYALAICIP